MRRRMSIKKYRISRVKMCEDIGNSDRHNMITQNCKSFICSLSENRVLMGHKFILVCKKLCCWWKGRSKWIVIVN
jgi:hypothetical protein